MGFTPSGWPCWEGWVADGVLRRRRRKNQVLKTAIAPRTTTLATTPPAIAPTLEDLEEVGDEAPLGKAVSEAEAVALEKPVAVTCAFVAVDSGASEGWVICLSLEAIIDLPPTLWARVTLKLADACVGMFRAKSKAVA